jgi:hypothetical protein
MEAMSNSAHQDSFEDDNNNEEEDQPASPMVGTNLGITLGAVPKRKPPTVLDYEVFAAIYAKPAEIYDKLVNTPNFGHIANRIIKDAGAKNVLPADFGLRFNGWKLMRAKKDQAQQRVYFENIKDQEKLVLLHTILRSGTFPPLVFALNSSQSLSNHRTCKLESHGRTCFGESGECRKCSSWSKYDCTSGLQSSAFRPLNVQNYPSCSG